MVRLRPCPQPIPAEVWQLKVASSQQDFVLPIHTIIAQQQPTEHFQLIYHQQQLVGFFLLDSGYNQQHDFAKHSDLGLRCFFIDLLAQGQGIASAALRQLPAYVAQQFPDAQRLVLTVNCRNLVAHQLYLTAGFQDSGYLYHGGPSGAQYVMWYEL